MSAEVCRLHTQIGCTTPKLVARRARAAHAGVSLSDYALGELERVAERPPVSDVLRSARSRTGGAPAAEVAAAVRAGRDRAQVLVVDTSALVTALVATDPPAGLIGRLSTDGDLHTPHVVDVELLHALRRLARTGALSADRAQDARLDFAELAILRHPHDQRADRAWELRENLTAYDAVFVALAEALEAPLVTCDARLARAPGVRANVELFAPAG